jgi:Gluconate 2-dehydrogenase subunit 3
MPYQAPDRRAATPGGQGRFNGFDVLGQVAKWDEVTAGAVLARLDPAPELSFFTPSEEATARALFDRLLGQDEPPRVPVLELVDSRLALDQTDGWFYEDMPEDRDAWRFTLAALDEDALTRYEVHFGELDTARQESLVQAVQDLTTWHGIRAGHVWSLWTRYACAAFYSHPWAWNEIGFGGPAYPRGYRTIGLDAREPWEVADSGS